MEKHSSKHSKPFLKVVTYLTILSFLFSNIAFALSDNQSSASKLRPTAPAETSTVSELMKSLGPRNQETKKVEAELKGREAAKPPEDRVVQEQALLKLQSIANVVDKEILTDAIMQEKVSPQFMVSTQERTGLSSPLMP